MAMKKVISNSSNKYRYLSRFLLNSNKDKIKLSFIEIEKIVQVDLPASAYRYRAFWSNDKTHSIALSWLSVGFVAKKVNLIEQEIVFAKEK